MFSQITGIKRQVLISSILYLGHFIFGFYIGWPGPILPKLRYPKESPLPYKLTETELSLIANMSMLGSIPAPFISGWLSNKIGRRPCFIGAGILAVIGSAILTAAKSLAMLYIGRFVVGLGVGIIAVINVVYIGEIASTSVRGILLTALGIFMTVGSTLTFAVGPILSYTAVTSIGLSVSIAFTLGSITLPESPIYYILKGNERKVIATLEELGRLEDLDLLQSQKDVNETSAGKDWKELFTIKSNRKALFIVMIINILQNCSGILAVIYFSASIFELAGSTLSTQVSMIIIGSFQFVGSFVTPFFIENIGRKTILKISCATCSISMFLLGLYFYLNYLESSIMTQVKWLPLVMLVIYFISYNFGFAIIPNVIIGEMFTPNVRSKGSALTMSVAWLFGCIVNIAFGVLLEILGGHWVFWFFTLTCVIALLFTIFAIPETKGKSLLEIQGLLSQ